MTRDTGRNEDQEDVKPGSKEDGSQILYKTSSDGNLGRRLFGFTTVLII
jgi:hypothetical protein